MNRLRPGLPGFSLVWAAHALFEPGNGLTIDVPEAHEVVRESDNLGLPERLEWPGNDALSFTHWDRFPEGGHDRVIIGHGLGKD